MSKKISKPPKAAAQTKGDKILKLLQRNTRATIAELMKATKWQSHSVRGFLSGALKKKRKLEIASSMEADNDRRYFAKGMAE